MPSNYPPGVTGAEPEITGDWPCPECGAKLPEDCPTCDGDGYLDIPDHATGGVLGPKPCPDCDEGSPQRCPGGCREPEHDAERDKCGASLPTEKPCHACGGAGEFPDPEGGFGYNCDSCGGSGDEPLHDTERDL